MLSHMMSRIGLRISIVLKDRPIQGKLLGVDNVGITVDIAGQVSMYPWTTIHGCYYN